MFRGETMRNLGKKVVATLVLGLMLVLGANSLFADSSNYRSYSYSTKAPDKYSLSRNDKVLVLVFGFDYQWENTIELAIHDALKDRKIDSVVFSDYAMLDYSLPEDKLMEETSAKMDSLSSSLNYNAAITGYLEDYSTYTYGGGVAELSATVMVASMDYSDGFLKKIQISTESKDNTMESLRATREDACKNMAEKIAEEYVKLLTN